LACEQLILIYEGVGSVDHSYAPSTGFVEINGGRRGCAEATRGKPGFLVRPTGSAAVDALFCSGSLSLQPIRQGFGPGGCTISRRLAIPSIAFCSRCRASMLGS